MIASIVYRDTKTRSGGSWWLVVKLGSVVNSFDLDVPAPGDRAGAIEAAEAFVARYNLPADAITRSWVSPVAAAAATMNAAADAIAACKVAIERVLRESASGAATIPSGTEALLVTAMNAIDPSVVDGLLAETRARR